VTRDPSKLTQRTFDLLIVGGGIMGAGIAWDASQRGFSCALVEQGDFASGTSSKTTKLIHGGIRYLENFDFGLVRQAIRERKTLLRLAPHLVQPLSFLIPVKGNAPRPWPLVRLGVALYDLLAGSARIQSHAFLNRKQISEQEPLLAQVGLRHGALYYDAQMDDARLVLEVLQSAADSGGVVANYIKLVRWKMAGGRLTGAEMEDRLSGTTISVKARMILNATGPWADRVRRLADPALPPIVRPSKGIHLVYPDLGLKHALVLASPADQRIFFLIPWRGVTLIGTTDTDCDEDPADVRAESDEVDYLIQGVNRLLPQLHLEKTGVISTFAGVRPLVAQEKKDPWAVSRSHLIHEDPNGLVSIVGGKFTTFRATAQEVVDWVGRCFPDKKLELCRTSSSPLGPQATSWRTPEMKEKLQSLLAGGDLYPPLVSRLVHRYGAQAVHLLEWIQSDSRMAEPLCPHHPFLKAEVRYALEQEMAVSIGDIFWRRFGIGHSICRGLDALEPAVQVGKDVLGWPLAEVQRQISEYRSEIALQFHVIS